MGGPVFFFSGRAAWRVTSLQCWNFGDPKSFECRLIAIWESYHMWNMPDMAMANIFLDVWPKWQGCMALHITSNTWCSQVSVGVLHPSKYGLVYPPWTQLLPEVVSASSASGAHSLVTGIYRYHTSKKTLCQRFGKFRVTSSETSRLVQELSRPSLTVAWLGLNNGSIPIFVGWVTIFSLRILDRNDVVIPPNDRIQLIKDPLKWWRFTFLFFWGDFAIKSQNFMSWSSFWKPSSAWAHRLTGLQRTETCLLGDASSGTRLYRLGGKGMGGMGGFLDNTKKGDPQKKPWKFQYYNDLEDDLGSHP